MAHEQIQDSKALKLPIQIISTSDLARLKREVELIDNFFLEAAIRGGSSAKSIPQISQHLGVLVSDNGLNILHNDDRLKLKEFLNEVSLKAPVVHLSFAVDPRPDFLMKILAWLRSEAHPFALIKIGLQPNIAAGCVMRTTNKYFDLSFKQKLAAGRDKLALSLKETV